MALPPKKSTNKKAPKAEKQEAKKDVPKKQEVQKDVPKKEQAKKDVPKKQQAEKPKKQEKSDPKKPQAEHDSFSTRLTKQISDNTVNGELNQIIAELKPKLESTPVLDEAGEQVLDKKGKPKTKEPKEISKYRSNKVRFSKGCGKYLSSILTKAVGDLLNLSAENAHANKKKTIHIDNLFDNHTMLKSKYLGLFVLLPEFNLRKQEVPSEEEGGEPELKYVLEDKGNKFVHYVEKKFKKELTEKKNSKGEVVKTMLGKDIKQYLNNLIMSFCEDFARKLELYLSGNGLKTVSADVIKTLVSILLSNNYTVRENNVSKEGEGDDIKVSTSVVYKNGDGEKLSDSV